MNCFFGEGVAKKPHTRFAPSPTGLLHLGNLRTALINWLYTRRHGGTFLLRLDDTDLERSEERYVKSIFEDLEWLGLTHDSTARQSDRFDLYGDAVEKLKKEGRLYACYETPEELDVKRKLALSKGKPPVYDRAALSLTDAQKEAFEKEGRRPHWRFKLASEEISWVDEVRGSVSFHADHLSDPVLLRADGVPVYTLASVVDDIDLHITHIIRGEDHVTNTAVQIQLFKALGGQPITFAHLPLITDKDGQGFSKRLGSLSIQHLRQQGLYPMAIHSLLARLGTSDPIEPFEELMPLIESCDLGKFARATPKLDVDELWQLHTKILHKLPFEKVDIEGISREFWERMKGNINTLEELSQWGDRLMKAHKFPVQDRAYIDHCLALLPPAPWTEEVASQWVSAIKEKTGKKGKDLFMPLRLALTGLEHGPELKDILLLMGREKVVERLTP